MDLLLYTSCWCSLLDKSNACSTHFNWGNNEAHPSFLKSAPRTGIESPWPSRCATGSEDLHFICPSLPWASCSCSWASIAGTTIAGFYSAGSVAYYMRILCGLYVDAVTAEGQEATEDDVGGLFQFPQWLYWQLFMLLVTRTNKSTWIAMKRYTSSIWTW